MAKQSASKQAGAKSGAITPLWIVAAFVTLTETVLGYALTQVAGGVQVALTAFVIIFAIIVAGAFFLILWSRPHVFYSPSEYGDIDPRHFADAMRPRIPDPVANQISEAKSRPNDQKAQFSLIDSLIDDQTRQHIILMHEQQISMRLSDSIGSHYELGGPRTWATGSMSGQAMRNKLGGTGLVDVVPDGPTLQLSVFGHEFARWLAAKGRKAEFFRSPLGSWGTPKRPDSMPQGITSLFNAPSPPPVAPTPSCEPSSQARSGIEPDPNGQ